MTARRRTSRLAAIAAAALLVPLVGSTPSIGAASPPDDTPTIITPKGEVADEISEADEAGDFAKLRDAYFESRLLAGDDEDATIEEAAQLRSDAIGASQDLSRVRLATAAETVGGPWQSVGPDPTVQIGRTTGTAQAVSGRVGALVVRNNGDIILGAAQGGVWTYSGKSGTWTSRTNNTDTQAVGALAIAPSNDSIVYMGSGEGALSGDSYYGDGVYRSADGGKSWTHVSGDFFLGNSTSDLVVDPTDANHVYMATLRGRGGIRRTTPPSQQQFGVWESKDGGATWTLLKGTSDEFAGATDLVMDPKDPRTLWASFWGDAIYRSTDGGATWAKAMAGLPPDGQYLAGATRFSLGISRPSASKPAVLYTGFDYFDGTGKHQASRLWRTSGSTVNWSVLPTGGPTTDPDSILDYCTTQCFYDNVITVDPRDTNTVYVAGSYGYDQSPQSGGIYRSTDGGQTWKSLGYDLHPDFHAVALQPSQPAHIVIGNDGGVWQSPNRGGRLADGAPLSAANWENLNGTVTPGGAFVRSTGLRITQFTSMATVPANPGQYWGGTQDNGTQRKSLAAGAAGSRWFDQPSGDGGQVLVDPDNPGYVFGTYFGISPYRFTPATVGFFAGNQTITNGINTGDRAEFYVPWVMNKANPNQLFLGTYRLYRTNNAEAASGGDVHWDRISGDLTTGCPGTAPNGARGCFISAVGVADGGDAVYTGSDDGKLFVNEHAVSSTFDPAHPNAGWTDITGSNLPNRPVSQFAVDRSNWRIAYVSFTGFSANTPSTPGSVFKTTNGGQSWQDITNDLPDSPVNSLVLDAAFPGTLYAGTDIGAFVSTDNGGSWHPLGTGMPKVSVWQLDFDPSHRILAAGTHGRAAYTLADAQNQAAPALIVSKADSGKPVGPDTDLDYAITVRNVGNQDASGVTVSDPIPAHTSFVAAEEGGTAGGGTVSWSGVSVPAGGSTDLHFTVHIDPSLDSSVTEIVDDGIEVAGGNVHGTVTGSPQTTAISPQFEAEVTPAHQSGGARVGASASYSVTITNSGYAHDTYDLAASGTWASTVYEADCTTAATSIAVASGDSADVCVKVAVPADAADAATSDTTLDVTSQGEPSASEQATMTTIAVAKDTLLVDNDGGAPNVQGIYQTALTTAGQSFSYWDLAAKPDLPASYLAAFHNVVWFTGNSYPAPITRYENELAAFLDGGGRLLMSGQDILDQAAGTTDFVKMYLHISWDGSEGQNDKATAAVSGVAGNAVSDGIGSVPLDHTVLNAAFEDQLTPIAPATPEFTGGSATYALTVAADSYKVSFLGFPLEAYGTAQQKADLVASTFSWFGTL